MIPYGRQSVDQTDIDEVVKVLRGDWLTTGPLVDQFELQFAEKVAASHAVAVCNGTAALHTALHACEIWPDDEVIVPAITFVATANAVVYMGGTPVFADVDPETLLMSPDDVRKKITEKTRAIIAVDYAGQPCDYRELRKIADEYGLILISDACHSLGASYEGRPVGSLADLTCFSFHPVKPITTGEGGMVTTQSLNFDKRMRCFRNHGISSDFRKRDKGNTHRYDMVSLGYNYRLTDLQCALGLSQLRKLDPFIERRNQIAKLYDNFLGEVRHVTPLSQQINIVNGYHLYVVKIGKTNEISRDIVFDRMRKSGIGVNVHYRPVYLNSFYYENFSHCVPTCPNAEAVYEEILSLPVFPDMTDRQVVEVVNSLELAMICSQVAA